MAIRLSNLLGRGKQKEDPDNHEEIQVPEGPYVAASLIYLCVVLLIGVPIWFQTCSKTRYSLPDLSQLEAKLSPTDHQSIRLSLEVSVVQLPQFGSLSNDQDHNLSSNQLTHFLRDNLPSHLETSMPNVVYDVGWRVRRPTSDEYRAFQSHWQKRNDATPQHNKLQAIRELELELNKLHRPSRFKLFIFYIHRQHHPHFCDIINSSSSSYLLSYERFAYICTPDATTNADYQSVLDLTLDAVKELYQSTVDADNMQHLIQGKVDLLFSLISESPQDLHRLPALASQLHSLYNKNVLRKYLELKELVNISPITQQLVDVLDDELLDKILERPKLDTNSINTSDSSQPPPPRVVKTSQVSQLFHRFESRISKHSSQNVYNALILLPNPTKQTIIYDTSLQNSNLSILQTQQSTSLLIVNDEKSLVLGMRALVRKLIGLSSVNLCKNCLLHRNVFFNRHELDTLMGALTIMKLSKVFTTLRSLNQQMIGLRISKEVSRMAHEAHGLVLNSIKHLETKSPVEAYRAANKAFELSELAYYDPTLIESSYFPDDLKYAIYTPLFLPLAPPFISSVVGIFKYFLQLRRSAG